MNNRHNNILENFNNLRENNKRLALEEQSKIDRLNEQDANFRNDYYKSLTRRNIKETAREKLIESARDNAFATIIKSIYITALEGETLTTDGLLLAENMVDNWIKENGGASNILTKVGNNTYLLSRITQIVEDAAEKEVEDIENADKEENKDSEGSIEDKKEDALNATKDFINSADKTHLKDFMNQVIDSMQNKAEENGAEKVSDNKEESEDDKESEKTDDSAVTDDVDEDTDIELTDDDEEDSKKDDSESDDAEDDSETNDDADADMDTVVDDEESDDDEELDIEIEDDDSESDDAEDDSKEDDSEADDADADGEEEDTESDDEDSLDTSLDDDLDEEDSEEEKDSDEEEEDSESDDEEVMSDDDVDKALGDDDHDESEDADITVNGDMDNDGDMFEELEDEDEVKKAIEVIRTRVADAEETFIRNNAEDKKKIDELISKISSNVKTMETANDKHKDEAEIAQESARMNKRKIDNIRNNRPLTVFEKMSRTIAENVIKNDQTKDMYVNESGTLDVDLVVETSKVMYGFLETINTLQLEKVDAKYIEKVLLGMRE